MGIRKLHGIEQSTINGRSVLDIDFINGRHTNDIFGASKYTQEIFKRIPGIRLKRIEYPQITKSPVIDGAIKRTLYPLIVKKNIRKSVIKHVTHQDLAFLLNIIDIHPSIVTCYDLIPVAYYKNNSLYWNMNLKGLRKADHVITISEFSKREIMKMTGISGDKISVIYPGVDTTHYFPKHDRSILSQYALTDQDYVIMYLGSEEPRKNIALLLNALYTLKKTLSNVKLLKVGAAQMGGDRRSVMALINDLHLENNVIFTGPVSETDLPKYYNAADLFVFPSFYEGFGLPPLEAMACGCPVITSGTTSLPEVLGEAGYFVDPSLEADLTNKMHEILTNEDVRKSLIIYGLERAHQFTWEYSAERTMEVYRNLQI